MTTLATMLRCATNIAKSFTEIVMLMVNALPLEFVKTASVLFVMETKVTLGQAYALQDTLAILQIPISNIVTRTAHPMQIVPPMRHVATTGSVLVEVALLVEQTSAQFLQLEPQPRKHQTESVTAHHQLAWLAPQMQHVVTVTSALMESLMQMESSTNQEPATLVNVAQTPIALTCLNTAIMVFAKLRLASLTLTAPELTSAMTEHAQLALFQEQETLQRATAHLDSGAALKLMESVKQVLVLLVNMTVVAVVKI